MRGLLWAHIGWLLFRFELPVQFRASARMEADPLVRWQREDMSQPVRWLAPWAVLAVERVLRAVQIALLNNRNLQATYEGLGVAQADVVQADRFLGVVDRVAEVEPDGGFRKPRIAQYGYRETRFPFFRHFGTFHHGSIAEHYVFPIFQLGKKRPFRHAECGGFLDQIISPRRGGE